MPALVLLGFWLLFNYLTFVALTVLPREWCGAMLLCQHVMAACCTDVGHWGDVNDMVQCTLCNDTRTAAASVHALVCKGYIAFLLL